MSNLSRSALKIKKKWFALVRKMSGLTGRVILPLVKRNQRMRVFLGRLNGRLMNATVWLTPEVLLPLTECIRRAENIKGDFGVNVTGHIQSESGMGEAVRANIRALEAVNIPFALNKIKAPQRQKETTYNRFVKDNLFMFNLFNVNADELPVVLDSMGIEYFMNKYNIGFWYWELSEFPEIWHDRFQFLNEIWVATTFCRESIGKVSPIPVHVIPPSIAVKANNHIKRSDFGLNEGSFVFIFMFDFFSFIERKNPFAIIEAFKMAFRSHEDVCLVLKCTNSDQNKRQRDLLVKASKGIRMKFIDQYLNREDVHGLVALSDCFVSLHRSEGFGLPIAEAMYLKKPVIATNYSGNTDFMDESNGFPVKYKLIEIEKDTGPYKKGKIWADPDREHAAELMRFVYENRDLAQKKGEKASRDISFRFSPNATGEMIRKRLSSIAQSYR